MKQWISECDERLSADMYKVAEDICANDSIKLVRLIGPTCAGKTTAANMLKERFLAYGKHLHLVSIDDFYFDTTVLAELSKKNGKKSIDYDSPDTIDIETLQKFVTEIFTNDRSRCPVFDFNVGKRTGYREYKCGKDDVFMFEGIQALYPNVTEVFKSIGHPSTEVYIAPQSSIKIGGKVFEPNEIRLMRRIVRDRNFRRAEAEFTFHMWESVRENEDANIFPFVGECEYSIDSTMPYEIGILKPYLQSALALIGDDSLYKEQSREILEKIEKVIAISDKLISEKSIYKEFV